MNSQMNSQDIFKKAFSYNNLAFIYSWYETVAVILAA